MPRTTVHQLAASGLALAAAALLAVTTAGCATAGRTASPAAASTTGAASTASPAAASTPMSDTKPASAVPGPAGGPVPRGFEPVSMTFVSASEGWVLGTAPCAQQPCTSVVRTTDGGRSWIGIPAPRYPLAAPGSDQGLTGLRFANALDGFAFGSQLWVTHDGGATWRHVLLPGPVSDLQTSAGLVYAAVINKVGAVAIYQSPASGGPWARVPGLPAREVPGDTWPGTITLHGSAAWMILGNQLYASQTGRNFVAEPVRCPSDYLMTSVAAYSTQQLTLLCVGGPAMGSAGKVLLASSDGGARFARSGVPPLGGDNFDQLAQPTAEHIFIATFSGATWLDVSGNGGRTWSQQLRLLNGGLPWSDFGFTTSRQGAAIEGNPAQGSRMYMTWNAGLAWHKIKF
jgi:photosystem II stability/assembly factor-like uncharacterized protein